MSVLKGSFAREQRDLDPVLSDEMTAEVLKGLKRSTRRAARDYLLDVTDLDDKLDRLAERRGSQRQTAPGGESRRARFDVGFHHLFPEIGMRYKFDDGSLQFSLGARGDVGVKYRGQGMGRTEIRAGFDRDDGYRLLCRFGF